MFSFLPKFKGQEVHINPGTSVKEKRHLKRCLRLLKAIESGQRSREGSRNGLKRELQSRIDYLKRRGINVSKSKQSILKELERYK